MKYEINATTGEVIERDMTAAEIKAESKEQAEVNAIRDARLNAQAAAKSALLDKLGITADEAKLLLS